MKRKIFVMLLAILAIVMVAPNVSAQNANRKGWVVELQGGQVFGPLYESLNFSYDKENGSPAYRKKGGAYAALNFGYRWTTSQSCAVEAKLIVGDNFSEAKLFTIGVIPGFRYTTKELFGNTSMYLGANLGIAITPISGNEEAGCYVLPEANVGFNLGSMVSLGLFFDYNIPVYGDFYKDDPQIAFSYFPLKSNATVGVKVGLRF